MPAFDSLEPAIDPNNKITFLLDWELTMKCNLDCTYCDTDLYGGHMNSVPHPKLDQCLPTIDFMYQYVDAYMQHRPRGIQHVVLNVYGGESLHHPDIVKILAECRKKYASYQDRWNLVITTTTNAVISDRKMQQIIPLIDEFTCSFHVEATKKQKEQYRRNVLAIRDQGRRVKCVLLMHPEPELFAEVQEMMAWCDQNQIRYLPRALDHHGLSQLNYQEKQVVWFKDFYSQRSHKTQFEVAVQHEQDRINLSDSGRACCGGRQVCLDQSQQQRHFFVENKFTDWHCSVNHFFLYVKQVTGEIFVNKDCKMNFDGSVGPIGKLDQIQKLLDQTCEQLTTNTVPIIQCKKYNCWCGMCAPKAKDLNTYKKIMSKYHK